MQGGAARFDPRLLFIFFFWGGYLNIDYISCGGRGSGELWLLRWHKGDGFNPRFRCSSWELILNLLQSSLPGWFCWFRQNFSSERWKVILNQSYGHTTVTFFSFIQTVFTCFPQILPSPQTRQSHLSLPSKEGVNNKNIFWFGSNLHSMWSDHRIVFCLNQLTFPKKCNKIVENFSFFFLQGTLMSLLIRASTYQKS